MRTCDAVVVGAGHNGLVAANILADAGWDVAVLEATGRAGGCVQTDDLADSGFRYEVCSAFYPLAAASPVLRELDLPSYGLTWCHAPAVLAHVLPDDRCVVLSRDVAETAASVAGFAASDGDAWIEEARRWERIGGPVLEGLLRPFPPVRAGARLLRSMTTGEAVRLARLAVLPVRRYGAERFAGDGARLLMAGSALHTDLVPEQSGSAIFGWLLTMLGQSVGFPVPRGGAGELAAALVRRLADRGVSVQYQRRVTRVLHARGTAVGVQDGDGTRIHARYAVIADVPAPALYRDLVGVDALPRRFVDDLRNFQWDNAILKINWALSRPVPWTASGVRGAGTVHLGGDLDGLSTYGAALSRRDLPDLPFVIVGQMTTSDPSRSPAGTESMWAYTHVPQQLADQDDQLRRQADRMQQLIEGHAPGFTASILARHIQFPADLQAHNPSLRGGALNAGTAALQQQLIFRPVVGLARADTPVDRLYLASASAHPGGGVHGAPGANAARAALARNGYGGGAYRRLVQGAHRRLYRDDADPA